MSDIEKKFQELKEMKDQTEHFVSIRATLLHLSENVRIEDSLLAEYAQERNKLLMEKQSLLLEIQEIERIYKPSTN